MKRIGFFFLFIILGFKINAQSKLFLSFDVSPTLSYRNYKLIDYSQGNTVFPSGKFYYDKFRKLYDSIESPKYGFQISLNLGYLITNKFSIQTGIQYKNIGVRYDITPFLGTLEFGGLIQHIYDYGRNQVVYSNFHYIGIPINLQYKLYSFYKFNVFINAGGATDFLIFHEEESELKKNPNTSQIADASDFSKIALNVNGGIKFSYAMNDKWDVFIMPQYNQYLTPNVKINLYTSDDLFLKFNQSNYYWNLNFGFRYRL